MKEYRQTTVGPLLAALILGGQAGATPKWVESVEVRDLHPKGASFSTISSTSDESHGGWAKFPNQTAGGYWNRLDGSFVDLQPPDATFLVSWVHDVDAGLQVGVAHLRSEQVIYSVESAVLWSGTPDSYVSLHPADAQRSAAYAIDDRWQGGYAEWETLEPRAFLWESTRQSAADLHPPETLGSIIFTISNGWQGGARSLEAGDQVVIHASAWLGTAESHRDLHPPGMGGSWITRNCGPHFVGFTWMEESSYAREEDRFAACWSGTMESYRSLHPEDAVSSEASDTDGEYHVGMADFGRGHHAVVWRGDTESMLDLHGALDGTLYLSSSASSMRREGKCLIVGGSATTEGRSHAIEWIVTLRDTRSPVIGEVEIVGPNEWDPRSRMVDLTFEVVVLDDFGSAGWYIEEAMSDHPGRGRRDIVVVDDATLRVYLRGHSRERTYTATLRAVDGAGNLSEPYPVSFQIDPPGHPEDGRCGEKVPPGSKGRPRAGQEGK